MTGPAFVGLSQTLPCLLANIWHALLQHPQQLELLQETPDLVPKALEELLRFAGMVHVLHRQAIEDMELDGMRIEAGQRLRLMLGVAHRDGEQFGAPDELDITRRLVRHFTFGSGSHSCAAAPLLRMATTIATRSFIEHFTIVENPAPVVWNGGIGFRWPASLHVIRREDPPRRT
jgi:cytochrome P450